MVTVSKKQSPLGERLRSFREAVGYTQVQVAEELGVTKQTVIRWEQGGSEPSFTELCVLARMFGKTLNDFAPESDDGPSGG